MPKTYYRRSGNLRSRIPTKSFYSIKIDPKFPGLVWNETMYAKKTWSMNSLLITMELLASYSYAKERTEERCRHALWQ